MNSEAQCHDLEQNNDVRHSFTAHRFLGIKPAAQTFTGIFALHT